MTTKPGRLPVIQARAVWTVAVAIAVLGGIVRLFGPNRGRRLTAAGIKVMDEQQFGRFLHSTGLDAKVEAVLTRRRAAR